MRKKIAVGMIVGLGVVLAACSGQPPTVSPGIAPAATLPRKSGTIRFSLQGTADVPDVPWFMALDSLKEQGYTVEVRNLASADLINEALVRGDIDIGAASTSFTWSAIAKGADIRTIVGRVNMTFSLVTKQAIRSCQDLDGKTLAFSSRQAVGYVMYVKYLEQHCAGVNPQIILMADSKNRVAALVANQVDGAYLEIQDWVYLNRQSPEKFHVLIDFAREFPQVQYSTFSVPREWAQQNPEIVQDYVRALLTANRLVMRNPQALQEGIGKYLSFDPGQAQVLAAAYIAAGVWDLNGGLTRENLQTTMDFMTSSGTVPQEQIEKVADLSYLDAVLNQIGRR